MLQRKRILWLGGPMIEPVGLFKHDNKYMALLVSIAGNISDD